MKSSNGKITWYSAGLHFECLQCGRCCSGPAQGYIWVTKHEIQLIARYLNTPVRELRRKFLRRVGFRTTIIEDPHTRDCIFLRPDKGCVIYQVRPKQCRSWPFWPDNLTAPDAWSDAARRCPGINRGKLYSPEMIQALMNNRRWWRPVLRFIQRSASEVGSPSAAKEGNEKP